MNKYINKQQTVKICSCQNGNVSLIWKFLMKKERRVRALGKELYQNRDFVKKIFSADTTI